MDDRLKQIEKKAIKDNIPIMHREALAYIKKLIEKYNIESILEIGTAVGHSAIQYALVNENVSLTSIEKNQEMFIQAVDNVKEMELNDRIELVFNDALEVELSKEYDLIIIDAAKTKNKEFFKKYRENLKPGGVIITDNIKFHGLVGKSSTIPGKNLRTLVRKIEEYIEFLELNEDYKTVFLSVGDGLAVSKKKED